MFTLRTARNSSELFDLNIVSPRVGCLPVCLLVLGVKPYQRLKSISVSSLRPREKKTDSTTYRPFTAETTFRVLMSTSDLNVQCRRAEGSFRRSGVGGSCAENIATPRGVKWQFFYGFFFRKNAPWVTAGKTRIR